MDFDLSDQAMFDIDEVMFKVDSIVEALNYVLNKDLDRKFCGGEREMAESNYKLFSEINTRLKQEAKIY